MIANSKKMAREPPTGNPTQENFEEPFSMLRILATLDIQQVVMYSNTSDASLYSFPTHQMSPYEVSQLTTVERYSYKHSYP